VKRGDVITVAGDGGYANKPRPAIVVQSDFFNPTHASVTVVPVTSTLMDAELFRIDLSPSKTNALKVKSQAMIDKIVSVRRDRVGGVVGSLTSAELDRIDDALRLWLAI
jgi:mRNA interferase MazF